MNSWKRLIGITFILSFTILSLNYFTSSANAQGDPIFFEDLDETNYENLDVLLFTNGKLTYQVFGEDEFYGSLYKLNVIDETGQMIGTYSFPDNHLFNTRYITSHPVIDENGNLLISYLKFNSTLYDSPFYMASISPTGKLNWEYEVGYYGPNPPTFGTDGTIYFVTAVLRHHDFENIGYVHALTKDGEELWKQKIAGEAYSAKPYINEENELVFATWLKGYQSLHYKLSLEGQILDLEITDAQTVPFYKDGNKYYIEEYVHADGVIEKTLKVTGHNNKSLWNYSFGSDNKDFPESIAHVTNAGIVYLSSDGHFIQPVASITNGSLNWTTNGIPLYFDNNVYTLNPLKGGSTSISKLDTASGKAIDTEIINFKHTDAVAFNNDIILLAVGKNIHKVTFDNEKTGWVKKNGEWLYYNQNGELKTGWLMDNGKWYYLDFSGVMKSGWYQENDKWYYSNGEWYPPKGKWYYATSSGEMQTGWIKDKNKWYFLSNSGAMESGWIKDKGTWYYTSSDGAMQTGWVKDQDKWYFLNSNGAMHTGWKLVNGKWYYLYADGHMAANTTIGGYKLDYSGAWVN